MYITAQDPRLRNDLYCVEWDVKLYYTIYHTKKWPTSNVMVILLYWAMSGIWNSDDAGCDDRRAIQLRRLHVQPGEGGRVRGQLGRQGRSPRVVDVRLGEPAQRRTVQSATARPVSTAAHRQIRLRRGVGRRQPTHPTVQRNTL